VYFTERTKSFEAIRLHDGGEGSKIMTIQVVCSLALVLISAVLALLVLCIICPKHNWNLERFTVVRL